MLKSRCYGYLANIVDETKEDKTRPKGILSHGVSWWQNELPSDREIKFSVNLIPGVAPISKALYRLGPVELKELKAKL